MKKGIFYIICSSIVQGVAIWMAVLLALFGVFSFNAAGSLPSGTNVIDEHKYRPHGAIGSSDEAAILIQFQQGRISEDQKTSIYCAFSDGFFYWEKTWSKTGWDTRHKMVITFNEKLDESTSFLFQVSNPLPTRAVGKISIEQKLILLESFELKTDRCAEATALAERMYRGSTGVIH